MRSVLAAVVACLALHADAFGQSTISVKDLAPSRVIGLLGKPLGTQTTIEGQYHPTLLENPLKITAVDGKAVTNNVIISVRGRDPQKEGRIVLKEGRSYRFEGYESGEFGSSPSWVTPTAQQNFHFYHIFIVTTVLEPKEK